MTATTPETIPLSCGLQAVLLLGERKPPAPSNPDARRSVAVVRSRQRRKSLPDQFDTV